jgi:5-methylcytosine-specific restriction protein A
MLRMLCCDAQVIPIVLNGAGQPLDVGRATRTIPDGLRRAVTARDRGCAHPGCDRPPSWSEIHHIREWARGGATRLDNLVMLCKVHHVRHEALFVPSGGERTPSATYRSGLLKLRAA